MANERRSWKFIILGFFIHILYLAAIFDVYFVSPIVQSLSPIPVKMQASPAKRLVLFIADGLRADRFFELDESFPKSRAPFLRSVIERKGAWGISHCREPTETRPGHVAVIAGFFEDVSAVTKGWQENPVDFDSVFNESRLTFAWGSYDVVPMFATKSAKDHVITDCYGENMIDFADKDGARLDEWVFNRVEKFFQVAKKNDTLNKQLNDDKLVFFLHLLGLDVNGHGYRPNSQEYLNNIISVDQGIQRTEQIFENFYNQDGKTAYIVTSDHGMSNWGSHGSSHPDETLTPIVAWGAGVRGPRDASVLETNDYKDTFSKDWQLLNLKRSDVQQIDIAPLMASLVGIPFPVNSIGTLPVDYLDTSDHFKAESMFRNAKQILAQYKKKQTDVKQSSIIFKPFTLTGSIQEEFLRDISSKIRYKNYRDAMELSRKLIKLSLDGLRYYHMHSTAHIAISATTGFIGWILLVVLEIVKNYTSIELKTNRLCAKTSSIYWLTETVFRRSFIAIAITVVISLQVTSAAFKEYLYCLVPLLIWYELAKQHLMITNLAGTLFHNISPLKVLTLLSSYGLLLCLLVASFTHREVLSVILLGLGIFPIASQRRWAFVSISWLLACLLLSIFPLLSTIAREEHYGYVTMAGFVVATSSLVYSCFIGNETRNCIVLSCIVGAAILCTFLRLHTAQSINSKAGLPIVNQLLSWILAPSVPTIALCTSRNSTARLFAIIASLISIYILTCVSHEGIFTCCLACAMILWIRLEQQLHHGKKVITNADRRFSLDTDDTTKQDSNSVSLTIDHVRISFIFVFFIFLAFFGTGNIASLNSFDPAAVNSFITIFKPFVMACILFIKILIPLLIVSCAFSAMKNSLRLQIRGLFFVVMVMTDIMSIMFFFLIKVEGSWQEIGTSITHFVIMLAFIIFLVPLFELACLLTGSVSLETEKQHIS